MTEADVVVLMEFLSGGALLGVVSAWIDQVAAYIRR
jgi:hypothetical protein